MLVCVIEKALLAVDDKKVAQCLQSDKASRGTETQSTQINISKCYLVDITILCGNVDKFAACEEKLLS